MKSFLLPNLKRRRTRKPLLVTPMLTQLQRSINLKSSMNTLVNNLSPGKEPTRRRRETTSRQIRLPRTSKSWLLVRKLTLVMSNLRIVRKLLFHQELLRPMKNVTPSVKFLPRTIMIRLLLINQLLLCQTPQWLSSPLNRTRKTSHPRRKRPRH